MGWSRVFVSVYISQLYDIVQYNNVKINFFFKYA